MTGTKQPPEIGATLQQQLEERFRGDGREAALKETLLALAKASGEIGALIRRGPLAGALGAQTGDANADGDAQKALDVVSNDIIRAALAPTSTAWFASEEADVIEPLRENGLLAVAVDPLDGSSNIDVNVSIGTIFSVFPSHSDGAEASFFRPGTEQLAAGYVIYGPHTAMVLTIGEGAQLYVLDPESGAFRLAAPRLEISRNTKEFAINASNYRHWLPPVRTFIDDCVEGAEGPRGKDFNMRWVASLVAETHRIFSRGGIFLYPGDQRPGYAKGRLRLVYEAAPIAMLVEQAGGRATDGLSRILEKTPSELHERTPLIFGSAEKVDRVQSYYANPDIERERSPLFSTRGLFRV